MVEYVEQAKIIFSYFHIPYLNIYNLDTCRLYFGLIAFVILLGFLIQYTLRWTVPLFGYSIRTGPATAHV